MLKRSLFLSVLLSIALFAQSIKPKAFQQWGDWLGTVPTSGTDVPTINPDGTTSTTRTVYITSLSLYSPTSTPDTCYVIDKQASPLPLYGTVAAPETVSGLLLMNFSDPGSHKMIGGIRWACTNGTTTAQITYEY